MGTAQYQGNTSLGRRELFNEPWLDSFVNETLLPGFPWHEVSDKTGAVLAENVKPLLQDPLERQLIFKLLGREFVQKHFSEYPNVPSLLCPPNLNDVEHLKREKNTMAWLWDECTKAAEHTGCQLSDGNLTELSPEMTSFVNHTYNLVEKEMDLLLAKHEAQEKENNLATDLATLTWRSFSRGQKRPKSIESKDLHFSIDKQTMFQVKENKAITGPAQRSPPLNCSGSDVLGSAVCTMISLDSDNMAMVCHRLSGKLLPKTLRQFIWMDKLLKCKRVYKGESIKIIEKEAREKYGRTLELKLAELKLRSATRSPISGLIENAVVEKYANTPSMHYFANDEQMILESSKSLNVLYVYNGTYEPYLIHWLFPLQMALKKTPNTAEHPYELFMYLHLLIKNIFPSWPEIFAMAERVMSTLKAEDTEFFIHLQDSFRRNVTFNPKDFVVELIAREREEALKLYAGIKELESHSTFHEELLATPVIFLRKWMGEGFVNCLDLPAVLLIWDQLFMQDWNGKVMESFCLAILMLLKGSFMAAHDYPGIRQIFLYDGYHLLTSDIQRAWIHLQQGGLLGDIPGFNQLNERQFRDPSPRLQVSTAGCFRKILPVGVKDVVLKLALPLQSDDLASSAWLNDFDPTAVKLTVSVFYGNVKLRSKTSSLKSSLLEQVKQNEANKKEITLFTIQFNDLYCFDSMDPSDYVTDTESGVEPFILLKVVYNSGDRDPLTLGWIKVDAFEQEIRSTQEVWEPREFSSLVSLHSGKDPDNINESTPGISRSGSHSSTIQLTVYDPTKENQTNIRNLVKREMRDTEERILTPMPFWVQHNESTALPPPTTLEQSFVLYIDALHYIPDNATIIKVSGKILNSGSNNMPAIEALPDLTSSARNPEFSFCQTINNKNERLNAASSIVFEVSTVDSDAGNVAVIGHCMLRVFNNEGKLNVGGFQLKLRTGLTSKQLDSSLSSDFQKCTIFPCCSLLIRLLPHTQDPVPVPRYSDGYYFTDEAKPRRSEMAIMSTFQKEILFPKHVKDIAGRLMEKEQSQVKEDRVKDWYEKRISGEKQSSLNYINIHHVVQYHQETGIRLRIKQAFGLGVEGLYINAFARILKGAQSKHLPPLQQNWGGEEKFLTRQHDFSSLQRSPRWIDPSVVLHPYMDNHSVLLIQLFGMGAVYIPNPNGQRGHVVSRNGQELELQSLLGWTVFPLFDRHYASSGIHNAPLFQGLPNAEFLHSLTSGPIKSAIKEGLKKKTLTFLPTYGSVTLEIWDGHYLDDELYALPVDNDLLTVGNVKKFLGTQTSKKGNDMSMLVLQSLGKKLQKLRKNSPEYQQHQQFYEEAMADKFYDLVEMALLNAGYGPL